MPGIDSAAARGDTLSFPAAARESFLDAIARHRRSAWRVTAVCAVAYALLGFVFAVLMSPLLYGLLGLALDVVNRFITMPNLLGFAGRQLDSIIDPHGPVSVSHVVEITVLAALPGLVMVFLAALTLRRALRMSPLFDASQPFGRPIDPTRLAEVQMRNTVEEMAIAAAIPAPRVIVIENSANAAAFDVDATHATVLIGAGIDDALTRAQTQAVAGHLVASVASGDGAIGLRTALILGLFSLAACLSVGWTDRRKFTASVRLARALLIPTRANLALILDRLSDPFGDPEQPVEDPVAAQDEQTVLVKDSSVMSWREWAVMPLMGPLIMSGFLCGLVNVMMLGPLVSLAWRQRKYTADAISVQLTRDPEALDGALNAIARSGAGLSIDPWAGHLCIVDPGRTQNKGVLGKSWVSIFPPVDRRHRALVRLGAAEDSEPSAHYTHMPFPKLILLTVLLSIVGVALAVVVVGLVYVATAVSALFTVLPIALLHSILR